MYSLSDFDFELPETLIAQYPLEKRSASRLLVVHDEQLTDSHFHHLIDYLDKDDLLVFNNTRVLKARFFGVKATGGKIEILIERILDNRTALAKIRASKSPKDNSTILIDGQLDVTVQGRQGEFYILRFPSDIFAILEQYGHLPLPPYIDRAADAYDETRYQTVFAREPGAVAAPTAGLHFDEELLDRLEQKGIRTAYLTLHVGAGTFQPVRSENLSEHKMHTEWYTIPQETVDAVRAAKAAGRKVVAVGTTSLRALESASRTGQLVAGSNETNLFITPGYRFRTVDHLVTNFHLPKSTLLMLVSAFAGYERIRKAYAHAIAQRYRFFSYGDAMLLEHRNDIPA
ncbi:tRNA preQ1(34) S-adenosylmethionine ribosyltransferase-isomerase QueA [Oxalobacter sp. OxGP1]|uniref:tRNA preQ1(34) S-adenosylmethionine ribosyltransferase-isomerase QueA n=1 Tax=Oxalobacter paeniformigenes TaxID=2946594 RepID=UPI0022AEC46C|nr:tRNA preQ1(34) S-adenosylmethionine ribosyltransferase-isomerase QueA [Oxalobacter paeniformigenes]MCZ4053551.1 tRNA preQ1(34) S-adenosylmethionine ribosyltransferase-isomerase QueA [Oxalobacter paeniformigenes]